MRRFSCAHWPDQALAHLELAAACRAFVVRIAGHQLQRRLVLGGFGDVERAVLRIDQRRQFRQQQLRDGQQIALALQHAGEPGDVGLQPVLVGVLARGCRQVPIISLMLSFSAATSPCASTAIDRVRSPLVTAVATSAIARTWVVRLAAS